MNVPRLAPVINNKLAVPKGKASGQNTADGIRDLY